MSTPQASETVKPVGQDPPSDSNTGLTTPPALQTLTAELNILEPPTLPESEKYNESVEPQVLSHTIQTEVTDPSVVQNDSGETKATHTDNMENKALPVSKISEGNKIDEVLEKIVEDVEEPKNEVQELDDNPSESNATENIKESTTNNRKNDTADIDTENKQGNAEVTQSPTISKVDPPIKNGKEVMQTEPETENHQQDNDTDTSDCVNIQELTEHVMNILNDGVVENVMSEQQLLKKNIDLQQFIVKLIHLLKEKTDLCANLDRQNSALISQAKSLKDVIAITKDLLGIRNMEIEHLHADMTAMEESIKEERNRHNLSVQRLNEAMTLNDKLKTEYLNQMDLFQKLREKYTEKVVNLTKENQRLNSLLNTDAQSAEPNTNEINDESNQIESVDK